MPPDPLYANPVGRMGRAPMSQIQMVESQISAEELARRVDERAKQELLALGRQGFGVHVESDFDGSYSPWLVRRDDGSVWRRQPGQPRNGYTAADHCVVVPGDSARWYYLTAARATGDPNAPRNVGELEGRRARREKALAEQAKAQAEALQAKRKAAQPFLLSYVRTGPDASMLSRASASRAGGGRSGGRAPV
jgi:hypothetical protein